MPTLRISDFSCIKQAELQTYPITVLIGPQASGKSVISKLLYFFSDVVLNQYSYADRGESIKPFLKSAAKLFSKSFPPNAWGPGNFRITYEAWPITFEVKRKKSAARKQSEEVLFEVSEYFENFYSGYFQATYRANRKSKSDDEMFSPYRPERWDLRNSSIRQLIKDMRAEYIEAQTFVPAGRSFFTNLGKAVAMLEFGSQLDDLTKRFGRHFTALLDGSPRYYMRDRTSSKTRDFFKYQTQTIESIIGGKIKLGSSDKYVETRDGRVIPLAMLSSGQQELLPLLLVLQNYVGANSEDKDPSSDLLYIEEPEAHLFPTAQSALVEHLAAISNFLRTRSKLFITTHSPYVLSTLNNLVKAHSVASESDEHAKLVAKLVAPQSWINSKSLAAYALNDGVLRSIKDESGLVDGSYLDEISNEISSVFMQLLEVENARD